MLIWLWGEASGVPGAGEIVSRAPAADAEPNHPARIVTAASAGANRDMGGAGKAAALRYAIACCGGIGRLLAHERAQRC